MRLHQISAANTSRGVKRVDDRRVITGIFQVLRTGIPLAGLPAQYGPHDLHPLRSLDLHGYP
ncbi:MAG: hypothetical protein Q4P24_03150 [Rhodobacterales bacterium]|nr:hypothetical protein [Rhodobacterales bacterium]